MFKMLLCYLSKLRLAGVILFGHMTWKYIRHEKEPRRIVMSACIAKQI